MGKTAASSLATFLVASAPERRPSTRSFVANFQLTSSKDETWVQIPNLVLMNPQDPFI